MTTREDAIRFCLTFEEAYEDYPFEDTNWTIMRHRGNRKMFAAIYERQGHIWLNLKCEPQMTFLWRDSFASVIPAYHMNKEHWNSVILDGTVPEDMVCQMIADSFALTSSKIKYS